MKKFPRLSAVKICGREMCTAVFMHKGFSSDSVSTPLKLHRPLQALKNTYVSIKWLSNRDGLEANRHLLGSWHTQIHLQRFYSSRRSLAVWPNSAAVHTMLFCSNVHDCLLVRLYKPNKILRLYDDSGLCQIVQIHQIKLEAH